MSKKQILSLSMIVKNENHPHLIQCLESVAPYIDYWVIADNGSTDGTQEVIKNFFKDKGIEGELHEVEWRGFGENRTEALQFCDDKADYALMIDADDYIEGKMKIPTNMDLDGYGLRIKRGDFTWWRNQIFKTGIGWRYVGVLHEYAECPDKQADKSITSGRIDGEYYVDARTLGGERNIGEDGASIDAIEKYSKDAVVLEDALKEEPENTRHQFYLAQSYFDSKQWEKAEVAYSKRASMGGWREEVFYSVFRVGVCKLLQDKPWIDAQDNLLQAWNIKPNRAEPLFHLARIHRNNGNPNLGYLFAKSALEIDYPQGDILFINDDVYKWMVLDEFAATAYYVEDFERGYAASKRLMQMMDKGEIPEQHRQRFLENLDHYEKALQEKYKKQATQKALKEKDASERREESNKNLQKKKKLKKKRKAKA